MRCWQLRAVSKPDICVIDAEDKRYYMATAAIPDCWLEFIRGEPQFATQPAAQENAENLEAELSNIWT
jgi:hypothetical protein